MGTSSDEDGGGGGSNKREERRERRRQRVHDRLANLIEENRMLTLLTQEDAEELQKLRFDLETSEMEKRRMATLTEQQDTVIKQLQDQIFHLEHCKFVADVQAKTIEQQDHNIKELIEENKLLNAQVTMDSETIRAMHSQLNEVVLERDRLATRVGKAIQRREEAEGEVKMLVEHAQELRESNVHLADRITGLEEQIRAYEEEDYADFFTRVSRRDIAKGALMPSEAKMLMIRRQGTPPEEREINQIARDSGVPAEVLHRLLPAPSTSASQALQIQQQSLVVAAAAGKGSSQVGGVLNLSPEQIRMLGASIAGASPTIKKFSSKGFELQFGISPERSSGGPKKSVSPDQHIQQLHDQQGHLRSSKEVQDLTQRKTDLPPPKSNVNHPPPPPSQQHQPLSPRPREEKEETPTAHVSPAPNRAAKSFALPSATAAALAETDHAFANAKEVLNMVYGAGHNTTSSNKQQEIANTHHPAKAPAAATMPASSEGGEWVEAPEHQKKPPAGGSMTSNPAARMEEPHRSGGGANKGPRRPLASLPVRDALSGSIVADDGSELRGEVDGDDAVLGPTNSGMLSPTQGIDSDSDTEIDSPSRTLERNSLLKERLELQRNAARNAINSVNSASHGVASVHQAPQAGGSGGPGPSFRTVRQQLQQSTDVPVSPNSSTADRQVLTSNVSLPALANTATQRSGSVVGGWDEIVSNAQYPLHGKGGSILKSSVPSPSGPSQSPVNTARNTPTPRAKNNKAAAVGSRKVLAPLPSAPATSTSPILPVHDRPSTCPLIIEAIYGERVCGEGEGGAVAGEKMYLVKYVSVESEQWTSASNVDPSSEALRTWLRHKAKGRMKQQAAAA